MHTVNTLWQRLHEKHRQQRLTHAQLFCGTNEVALQELALRLASMQLCHSNTSCGQCQPCQLLAEKLHPDVTYLRSEKPGSAIRVDQIRELQPWVYTSAQLGSKRLIIIESAEKMNNAASNALLKMLEEPPPSVYFILLAKHLNTIAPTIISRCQLWHLPMEEVFADYLLYSKQDITEQKQVVSDLENVLQHTDSVCSVATRWAQYDFHKLMIFLYLLHGQLIKLNLMNQGDVALNTLLKQVKLSILFKQLDKINGIFKNLNHTISVNQLLALENLLLGYLE